MPSPGAPSGAAGFLTCRRQNAGRAGWKLRFRARSFSINPYKSSTRPYNPTSDRVPQAYRGGGGHGIAGGHCRCGLRMSPRDTGGCIGGRWAGEVVVPQFGPTAPCAAVGNLPRSNNARRRCAPSTVIGSVLPRLSPSPSRLAGRRSCVS